LIPLNSGVLNLGEEEAFYKMIQQHDIMPHNHGSHPRTAKAYQVTKKQQTR
jgi:hypothetical protein